MVTMSGQDQHLGHFGVLGESANGDARNCRYGFFSRWGGVSGAAFENLNIGLHVDDDPSQVLVNRKRLKNRIGASRLLSALQVHGTEVYVQDKPLMEDLEVDGCDALITNQPSVALMVQHADCQPVLLVDRSVGAIAAVHSGWRGSVQNILAKVVTALTREFSSDPKNIHAVIGPSLGPCCAEFINYATELPENFLHFKQGENHFDFWRISKRQLLNAGLKVDHVEIIGKCTCCSSDYFSYRRAVRTGSGLTGRNGSLILLDECR